MQAPDLTTSLKEVGLNKAIIQQKVNQLVRELHGVEESEDIARIISQRRNRKKDSDKSRGDSASPSGGVQAEIRAFFVSTKTVSKKDKVVMLSDNEEDLINTKSRANGKRKETSHSKESQSSAEKKSRKTSNKSISNKDTAKTGKRKDEGENSLSESSTPEKKLRTLTNVD